jgi:hypothetical protein
VVVKVRTAPPTLPRDVVLTKPDRLASTTGVTVPAQRPGEVPRRIANSAARECLSCSRGPGGSIRRRAGTSSLAAHRSRFRTPARDLACCRQPEISAMKGAVFRLSESH